MTPEELATRVTAELSARDADMPFDAVLMLVRTTRPPAAGPPTSPGEIADLWFRLRFAAPLTAAGWDVAADPSPMLARVRFRGPARELTLFGCACCRRIWDLLPGDAYRRAVEATEAFARGGLGREAWEAAFAALGGPEMDAADDAGRTAAAAVTDLDEPGYHAAANPSLQAAAARAGGRRDGPAYLAERAAQAALLRERVGNPLRPTVRSAG